MTKTVGYKAMNKDMTCRGYHFKIGKTYTVNNKKPLELCSDSGFHFCLNLEDVFNYYDYTDCSVFEVETESEVLTKGDKSITKTITIKRELTQDDFNKYEFKKILYSIYLKNTLSDEELLSFKNDYWCIRRAVAKQMTDLDLMFNTFKDDEDWGVRLTVVEKMTDLDLMYRNFKYDEDWKVRLAVVLKMTDLDLVYRTFYYDRDEDVRLAVIRRMNKK